jgi:ribonuclease P protein component
MDAPEGESGPRGFGFPRGARITRTLEIRALFRRGKRRKTRHLDVFVSPSPVAHARLGIVVPKHKRGIVQRNLLKRRLREAGRRLVLPAFAEAGVALDVMLRARPEAYGAEFQALWDELAELVGELCSRGR